MAFINTASMPLHKKSPVPCANRAFLVLPDPLSFTHKAHSALSKTPCTNAGQVVERKPDKIKTPPEQCSWRGGVVCVCVGECLKTSGMIPNTFYDCNRLFSFSSRNFSIFGSFSSHSLHVSLLPVFFTSLFYPFLLHVSRYQASLYTHEYSSTFTIEMPYHSGYN